MIFKDEGELILIEEKLFSRRNTPRNRQPNKHCMEQQSLFLVGEVGGIPGTIFVSSSCWMCYQGNYQQRKLGLSQKTICMHSQTTYKGQISVNVYVFSRKYGLFEYCFTLRYSISVSVFLSEAISAPTYLLLDPIEFLYRF